jgi:hypothetical protein
MAGMRVLVWALLSPLVARIELASTTSKVSTVRPSRILVSKQYIIFFLLYGKHALELRGCQSPVSPMLPIASMGTPGMFMHSNAGSPKMLHHRCIV